MMPPVEESTVPGIALCDLQEDDVEMNAGTSGVFTGSGSFSTAAAASADEDVR